DLDFDDLRGIAKCHGSAHGAPAMRAALVFDGHREGPLHGDAATLRERGRRDLAERESRAFRAADTKPLPDTLDQVRTAREPARRGREKEVAQLLRGVDRGVADHEGNARG